MSINVESSNTRYGKIAQSFKYEVETVPGKNVDDLLKVYTMKPVSHSMLETIIGGNVSQFSLRRAMRTPQERKAALQRSQQAQKLIAHDIATIAKTKYELQTIAGSISDLDRSDTIYFRTEGTNEATQFNLDYLKACRDAKNHPEVLAQLQYTEIEKARTAAGIRSPEDLSALFDASEQELLDRYPAINRYLRILAETQALAQSEALTSQQREQLQKYQVGMNLMGVVEARMDLMANPIYPDIDPHPLYGNAATANDIAESMTSAGFPEEDLGRAWNILHPLPSYFESLKEYSEQYASGILERAFMENPDLENATFNSIYPVRELMNGKPLVGHTKNGENFVLTNRSPLKVQSASEHMKELAELAIKADKWLLTGSRQFADMQTALNELLATDPKPMSREERAQKAGELVQKATEYLEHKRIQPPYDAATVMNRGKNQREQSRLDAAISILYYADAQKTALENDLRNEKLLNEVSVNINASKQQRNAFALHLNDLIMPDARGAALQKPVTNEEFSALVMLACGSRQVAGDNAEAIYADMIQSSVFDGKVPTTEQVQLTAKAGELVKNAINNGDTRLLSQLVAEGLQQNNKLLQKQAAINDKFCFLADLGGQVQQIQKNHPGILENVSLSKEDTQILNAAKAISDLRAKGLECQRDLAFRFGQGKEMTTQDAKDLATVCQMHGVNKQFVGTHDLSDSPYGKIPSFAKQCNQELMKSSTVTDFLVDNMPKEKLPAVQNAKEMTILHDKFMDELVKARLKQQQLQQQQQQRLATNTIQQQQPKASPTMTNG